MHMVRDKQVENRAGGKLLEFSNFGIDKQSVQKEEQSERPKSAAAIIISNLCSYIKR